MIIDCGLCFHHCKLDEGQTGFCYARQNVNGKIIPLNYGRVTAIALDPVEKKPLRRFHPGKMILSIGGFGCNLHCPFCQNDDISTANQENARTASVTVDELIHQAVKYKEMGNIGIAYTYNEPLVNFEFVRDCSEMIHQVGMYNVLVTNGTIEQPYLDQLLPFIDAMNIDLKGFTPEFYQKLGGDLESVKRTIKIASEHCHVEVTTLIIPDENDSEQEMRELTGWLSQIDPEIPYHISRFFPRYRYAEKKPTPVNEVYHLAEIAKEKMRFVYTGNC